MPRAKSARSPSSAAEVTSSQASCQVTLPVPPVSATRPVTPPSTIAPEAICVACLPHTDMQTAPACGDDGGGYTRVLPTAEERSVPFSPALHAGIQRTEARHMQIFSSLLSMVRRQDNSAVSSAEPKPLEIFWSGYYATPYPGRGSSLNFGKVSSPLVRRWLRLHRATGDLLRICR